MMHPTQPPLYTSSHYHPQTASITPHHHNTFLETKPALQQKDWIRELATMITCIREDLGMTDNSKEIEQALSKVIE
jgi:hypothetical protein